MSLDTPFQIEQMWGSHQAVLKGVLKVLKPKIAVECGSGDYSTPLLREYTQKLTTIEHDKKWAVKVQESCPANPNHIWIVEPFPLVKNWTSMDEIPLLHRKMIKAVYEKMAQNLSPFDFLFMDTFRAARVPAVKQLLSKTNMLLLHDVEGPSYDYYQFGEIQDILKGLYRYEQRPDIRINKIHTVPWTALYTREPLNIDLLQPIVEKESERLWKQKVGLEKINGS